MPLEADHCRLRLVIFVLNFLVGYKDVTNQHHYRPMRVQYTHKKGIERSRPLVHRKHVVPLNANAFVNSTGKTPEMRHGMSILGSTHERLLTHLANEPTG